jgi:hypothetical protein
MGVSDMDMRHETDKRLTRRLSRDTLEDVVHERVEDGHRLVRDTSVGVDLLKDWDAVRVSMRRV